MQGDMERWRKALPRCTKITSMKVWTLMNILSTIILRVGIFLYFIIVDEEMFFFPFLHMHRMFGSSPRMPHHPCGCHAHYGRCLIFNIEFGGHRYRREKALSQVWRQFSATISSGMAIYGWLPDNLVYFH